MKTVGRIGRAYVVAVLDWESVELLLLDAAGRPDPARRTVADGMDTSTMVNGQTATVPGVFYCPGAWGNGRSYHLQAATLELDDIKDVVGGK